MSENSKGKILIVDDQQNIRESMADILSMEGYEVHSFENGFDALEKVKEISFDVAFLDIKMPGMNGIETFKEIKSISPETVVFIITGVTEQDVLKQVIDEGAHAVINKPFDMEGIIESIQKAKEKTTVLIVDRQLDMEASSRHLLSKGYHVVCVSDENEAKRSLARKPVDVILYDTKDRLKTNELYERVKVITGEDDPQIIMINSFEADGTAGEILTVGTKQFVKKAINMSDIEKALSEILRNKEKKEVPEVLVFSDDASEANVLSVQLNQTGCNMTVVSKPEDVLDRARNGNFTVVIINAKIPSEESIEISDKIKVISPHTEILIITETPKDGILMDAIGKSSYTFVHKPFDPREIVEIVSKFREIHKRMKR
ncbi:MAG: response regulator [Endomicrobiales bacterium]|nr:response regulator [Endomicrobiales bacterium]